MLLVTQMTLELNGTDIPVGQTTTNMCTATTNTLCAPPGFACLIHGQGPGSPVTQIGVLPPLLRTYSGYTRYAGNQLSKPSYILHLT